MKKLKILLDEKFGSGINNIILSALYTNYLAKGSEITLHELYQALTGYNRKENPKALKSLRFHLQKHPYASIKTKTIANKTYEVVELTSIPSEWNNKKYRFSKIFSLEERTCGKASFDKIEATHPIFLEIVRTRTKKQWSVIKIDSYSYRHAFKEWLTNDWTNNLVEKGIIKGYEVLEKNNKQIKFKFIYQ